MTQGGAAIRKTRNKVNISLNIFIFFIDPPFLLEPRWRNVPGVSPISFSTNVQSSTWLTSHFPAYPLFE
jgi:predicted enzyme involved in methoxymalonyl-ACP biosynthesis